MTWSPYKNSETLGKAGSENGIIVADEEYERGIRIALEAGGRTAPFAITCGIYDHLVHTVFFGSEGDARRTYDEMKAELVRIYDMIPDADDPKEDDRRDERYRAIRALVERF